MELTHSFLTLLVEEPSEGAIHFFRLTRRSLL